VLITLVSVGSRGRIRLRSADPRHKPAIDPAYLSDTADLEPLVRAIGMAREFAAARPLSQDLPKSELAPGARRAQRNRAAGVDPPATSARSTTRSAPARWAATPGWRPAS
jgi:choline dehydrogenase-like flavoprotein